MDLQFNVELAAKYGLDEAVFLNSIYFWIRKNAANKKNRKDGHYWTYNTRTALADLFPFWSPRQIDRITKSCVDQGLLLVSHPDGMNRTTWYALTDLAEKLFGMTQQNDESVSPNGDTEPCDAFHQTVNSNTPNGDSVSPNGEMYIRNSKGTKKDQKRKVSAGADVHSQLLERCEPYGQAVVSSMQKFLQMRTELKKPLKSKQAATMLWNNLLHLSYGDPPWMAKLLDKANEHQWLTVYQLKDDELPYQSGVVEMGGMRVL